MLDFLITYGPTILSGLGAFGAGLGGIYSILKVFKIGKKVDANIARTDEEIKITREGIVEAFKTAHIPTEWKISVAGQVNQILTDWRNEFLGILNEQEALRTKMMAAILKILNYTAASNKLTEAEKKDIEELLRLITERDGIIDISDIATATKTTTATNSNVNTLTTNIKITK